VNRADDDERMANSRPISHSSHGLTRRHVLRAGLTAALAAGAAAAVPGLAEASPIYPDDGAAHRLNPGGLGPTGLDPNRLDPSRLDPSRDLLIITADHGCDPTTPGTDHTREHAPLLARFDGHGGRRHDGPFADVGASVLKWLTGADAPLPGTPFV